MRLFNQKTLTVWLIGLLTALCIWMPQFFIPGLFDRPNNLVFDAYQQIKPRKWAGSNVVVVDIDEDSIKRIGQWPWPRDFMGEMTDKLGQLGAATIVFDVVFSEPDRTSPIFSVEKLRSSGANVTLPESSADLDHDQIFAKAIARNRVVTGLVLSEESKAKPPLPKAGHGFSGSEPPGMMDRNTGAIRNLDIFDEAATGIGTFSLSNEFQTDGIIRQVKLLDGFGGSFYPNLAIEALRVAQGAGGFKLKSSDGSGEADAGELRMVSVQVGAFDIPTGARGEMPIYHSLTKDKPSISVRSLMFPDEYGVPIEKLAAAIEGRIVLIGTSAAGLRDLRSTPSEPVVPGVFIHADILDQILSESYLVRPDYAKGIELVTAIIAVMVLLFIRPFISSIMAGILAIATSLGSIWFFWFQFAEQQLLFSPLLLLLSVVLSYSTASAALFFLTEKEGRFLRGAFSQYLSPTLVKKLVRNPAELVLGGEEKELTLLFCDIRGFTALSEKLDPTELTDLLNSFLTPMTSILLKNGATIDKYMGDAIMAFWNAPIGQKKHRDRACKSVMEMREALIKLNLEKDMNLQIGIGLNTGMACVGNLGSAQRFSYSAIGDAVNVASRIEGLTKQYGLDNLAAAETLKTETEFSHIDIDFVSVVGREEPLLIKHLLDTSRIPDALSVEELIREHKSMVAAYQSKNLKQAAHHISVLKKIAPQELQTLYSAYSARIKDFSKNGIPKAWNGVYVARSK